MSPDRALIIDDEPDICEFIKDVAEENGLSSSGAIFDVNFLVLRYISNNVSFAKITIFLHNK